MPRANDLSTPDPVAADADDAALIERILAGDEASFELLMRRNNQRLFRAARSIVRNATDAEDVVQEAYFKAFLALARFERRSSLGAWLLRITINEALTRAERARRIVPLHTVVNSAGDVPDDPSSPGSGWLAHPSRDPEAAAGDGELHGVLAGAVERLPDSLRTVFVLRSVEEMSVEETAECLQISHEAVRVRLHRAKALLRDAVDQRLSEESRRLYAFGYERCDRLVSRVLERIRGSRDSRSAEDASL
jgi:RNA polymerase sigma-70 factor (ECF subfamily)